MLSAEIDTDTDTDCGVWVDQSATCDPVLGAEFYITDETPLVHCVQS